MITVRELIDLYKGEYDFLYINDKKYEPVYNNIKVIGFDIVSYYDGNYELWIDVDPKDKNEIDNNCYNPFD